MSASSAPGAPLRRVVLWGLLLAVVGAVAVAFLAGDSWRGEPPAPLPVISELPDFALHNRDGRAIDRRALLGRPWVADFIFTRCGYSCPRLTEAMQRLINALPVSADAALVSITVDPEYDTVEVLRDYAAGRGIEDDRWLFLTGERAEVLSLVRDGFLLAVDDSPEAAAASPSEPIVHSNRFMLVDHTARVRGAYDPFAPGGLDTLAADLQRLMSEAARQGVGP